jgi:predicted O-methyltransferase YrrM
MYSSIEIAAKYLKYYFKASNRKGHGIHSPFIFDFVTNVLNDHKRYKCYDKIELLRKSLLKNNSMIKVEDFGAGSTSLKFDERKIKDIARTSLKNKKFSQLLFRIARHYQSENIIELGTSLGVTTCYLGSAKITAQVYTFEGSPQIAQIAKENFAKAGLTNIHLIEGNFSETFFPFIEGIENINLAFVDGNHKKEPTLKYFYSLEKKATSNSVFIFDDIHWSREMEEAWNLIRQHESVTVSVDLFFIGIVFFNPDFKFRQHFTIRF